MSRERIDTVWHYSFIHNVYARLFYDILEYFGTYLYPRFEYRVVGTYDKAVEYITKKEKFGKEIDKAIKPALILNPSGEFDLAEGIAGGKQLWRFPNLAPGMIKYISDPVYVDKNMLVNIGFLRVRGEIELIMLLESFYEYCDLRLFLIQMFGGLGRPIYPNYFNTFIILDNDLVNYTYINQITGESYKLDWEANGAKDMLVKSTNKNELVIPVRIKPLLVLSSMSDGSEKYGGPDSLADWILRATVEYEVEIPSYMILETDILVGNVVFETRFSSCFSENSFEVPINRTMRKHVSNGCIELPDLAFKDRYYHIVTEGDLLNHSTTGLKITLPERVDDYSKIIVVSKYGVMSPGDHYILEEDGTKLAISKEAVKLEKDMIIEIYTYTE